MTTMDCRTQFDGFEIERLIVPCRFRFHLNTSVIIETRNWDVLFVSIIFLQKTIISYYPLYPTLDFGTL